MPLFLAINVLLGVIVLSAIVALTMWAIRTQRADSLDPSHEQRQARDQREREVPNLPARARRRQAEPANPSRGSAATRRTEHGFGATAAD
ncbi:MAG: hypothetical protein QOF83_4217 [Solirubrobacteraceae bacterium]|jgi:predicted lipid-binding transport protein (Tim44 family)|nr:hypothetical protein [Solirubrobacteraceae bacterium]